MRALPLACSWGSGVEGGPLRSNPGHSLGCRPCQGEQSWLGREGTCLLPLDVTRSGGELTWKQAFSRGQAWSSLPGAP